MQKNADSSTMVGAMGEKHITYVSQPADISACTF